MKAGTRRFWVRTDWLKWAALAFALVSTFHAEHALAVAVGVNEHIAYAVPGALDAYVVRTLRTHREVLTAVLAMVAVNAVSYLISFGVLAVTWPVVVGVSAIAPLVLWRVHALGTPGQRRERKLWGLPARPEHAPDPVEHAEHSAWTNTPIVPGHIPYPVPIVEPDNTPQTPAEHDNTLRCEWGICGHDACTVTCDWCGWEDCPVERLDVHKRDACPKRWEHKASTLDEHADTAIRVVSDEPSTTVLGWVDELPHWASTGELKPSTPEHIDVTEHGDTGTTVLTLVPDLPAGYEHDTHAVPVLHPADREHEDAARTVWDEQGTSCTLRAMKTGTGTGTDRARRLLNHLRAEHAHNTSTGGSTS